MPQGDVPETERIARLAHELRNRIAPIRNVVQLLRMRDRADSGLGPLVEIVERQLEAMVRAIDLAVDAVRTGQDRPPGPPRQEPAHRRRRVLVADDNEAMRGSLGEILRDQGHSVKVAADGAAALRVAVDWLPEIVILDIRMPQMDGYEVARRLRAKYFPLQMKLVMMSGNTLEKAAERNAMQAGFDLCIDKVIDPGRLATLLQEAQGIG